jgi:heme O synthase-like polyprenyltransferase
MPRFLDVLNNAAIVFALLLMFAGVVWLWFAGDAPPF